MTARALWKLCCSLKLAIVLASLATLLGMGGSLVIHFHPELFGRLDSLAFADWLRHDGIRRPELTWWLWLAGLLVLLLGINTLCCLLDWLRHLRSRWRKTGEYLIHAGFVLCVIAFTIGSLAGSRNDSVRIFVGGEFTLPDRSGLSLRLDAFVPDLDPRGRPLDMRSQVTLLRNGTTLTSGEVRINQPLLYRDLVVVPVSFGRQLQGFRCYMPGRGDLLLSEGNRLGFSGGRELQVLEFLPDAVRTGNGEAVKRSDRLDSPAARLALFQDGTLNWTGWYFLRDSLPYPLLAAGLRFWPVEPLFNSYSLLTVNRDPGAWAALAGALLMLAGVLLAAVSYYRKRRHGDRPELS